MVEFIDNHIFERRVIFCWIENNKIRYSFFITFSFLSWLKNSLFFNLNEKKEDQKKRKIVVYRMYHKLCVKLFCVLFHPKMKELFPTKINVGGFMQSFIMEENNTTVVVQITE